MKKNKIFFLVFCILVLSGPVHSYSLREFFNAVDDAMTEPFRRTLVGEIDDWVPSNGSINVDGDRVLVKLNFSQKNIDFYNKAICGSSMRIPFALEIDVVDHDSTLGDPENGNVLKLSNNLQSAGVFRDVGAFDNLPTLSAVIQRPDLLSAGQTYFLEFQLDQAPTKVGYVYLNIQIALDLLRLPDVLNCSQGSQSVNDNGWFYAVLETWSFLDNDKNGLKTVVPEEASMSWGSNLVGYIDYPSSSAQGDPDNTASDGDTTEPDQVDESAITSSINDFVLTLDTDTSNPYTQAADIHITHTKIRPYKEGSWHHQVDVDMAAGQTFLFELEGRVRNKSNYDLDNVDIDYCFVKDDKDFDVSSSERMRIDDDQVDIKEGDKESKHTRRSRVVVASDLSQITVYTDGESSFSLSITQDNLDDEKITLYFYLDVETENEEDRDVSDEAKRDEYGKLEIHLVLPTPPVADLNLSVPTNQEYIQDKTKNILMGVSTYIPVRVYKSGQDTLTSYPEVSLELSGPEFATTQILTSMSADYIDLNSDGEDTLDVQISSIDTPGNYYLKVCVDPQGYISESNEDDNCNHVHFVVKKKRSLTPINYFLLESN